MTQYQIIRALWVCLGFALCGASALAQPNDKVIAVEVGGAAFRVPATYLNFDSDRLKGKDRPNGSLPRPEGSVIGIENLGFRFWLSDRAPLWIGARSLPPQALVGPGFYWPPQPARPFLTASDFLVHVNVRPLSQQQGMAGQAMLRGTGLPTDRKIETYGRLSCAINWNRPTPILCSNPIEDGPPVYIHGSARFVFKEGSYSAMRLYFYSRAEELLGTIDFPEHGLPRWEEIVCQTLSLLRSWRENVASTVEQACSTQPRLTNR